MKRFQILLLFSFVFLVAYTSADAQQTGQDSTGLPGDNFSLQGAMQMFKEAPSPEDFEKAINTEGNHVNNLDLNNDGETDYVRVVDMADVKAHVFVLQVPVSESENQDIATIEVEKTGDTSAVVQIIGDEDIYGEEVIIEPDGGGSDEGMDEKKGKGPYVQAFYDDARIVVNVWFWPSIRFVYAPHYRPWVSPWRWRHYPTWWRPWRPLHWHVWHPHHRHYHRSHVVVHTHRTIHAHKIYTPKRTTSVSVRTRHASSVGNYRVKRSKATVTGPRGGTATVKRTTVKGPRGNSATVKRGTATSPRGNVKTSRTVVKRKRG